MSTVGLITRGDPIDPDGMPDALTVLVALVGGFWLTVAAIVAVLLWARRRRRDDAAFKASLRQAAGRESGRIWGKRRRDS